MAKFNELWWHLTKVWKGVVIALWPILTIAIILKSETVMDTLLPMGWFYGILLVNWWIIPEVKLKEL